MNKYIYQVHDRSGCWEDYRDIIRGTFINKENAMYFMSDLIEKQNINIAQSKKCLTCQQGDCDITPNCFKPDPKFPEECFDYYYLYDESSFDIEEVEVLDWES